MLHFLVCGIYSMDLPFLHATYFILKLPFGLVYLLTLPIASGLAAVADMVLCIFLKHSKWRWIGIANGIAGVFVLLFYINRIVDFVSMSVPYWIVIVETMVIWFCWVIRIIKSHHAS